MNPGNVVPHNAVLDDEELKEGLRRLDPAWGEFCIRASGEAYAKPLLSQKVKIMLALAVDVVEQLKGPEFANHVKMAKKQGMTREEMEEFLFFMSIYAGFNKTGGYFAQLNDLFGVEKGRTA